MSKARRAIPRRSVKSKKRKATKPVKEITKKKEVIPDAPHKPLTEGKQTIMRAKPFKGTLKKIKGVYYPTYELKQPSLVPAQYTNRADNGTDHDVQDLVRKLDDIDAACVKDVGDRYYQSRLKIYWGMWEKGEAIQQFVLNYRGVNLNTEKPYCFLSKATGRAYQSLEKWHKMYLKYSKKVDFQAYAEDQCKWWAFRALKGYHSYIIEHPQQPPPEYKKQSDVLKKITSKKRERERLEARMKAIEEKIRNCEQEISALENIMQGLPDEEE